ncbi:hypothetical protein [Nonomuraea dietziae]|uniref:Secreted protein n=2 Tax=Nonomuraea dietziae TaxID=65515 RepID=A0A7W5UU71_9ACTN|nr:hypothetical protein [Nonomuraea dietziae]MBB3724692.1 hypothetical protein [Nonomuraea dietziae]
MVNRLCRTAGILALVLATTLGGGAAADPVPLDPDSAMTMDPVTPDPETTDFLVPEETQVGVQAAAGPIGGSCGPNINPYPYVPRESDRWYRGGVQAGAGAARLYTSKNRVYYNRNTKRHERIYWVWGSNLKPGDVVTLDWSDDNRRTWRYCHRTIASGKSSVTTPAINNWGSRWFRTCFKLKVWGYWSCDYYKTWYTD